MTVRVRFAPSPTGFLHIGTSRTVLFDWLLARHSGGQFVLRIEDTDKEREVPGAVENITESLRWLGLDPDEGPEQGGPYGPYTQSQRLDIYHKYADQLVEQGDAYPCFTTAEELAALREEQKARGVPTGYDRRCRNLSQDERERRIAAGESYVIRFATPLTGHSSYIDELRGEISVENSTLDDFVIIKSDGYPTYNFAHVVDDYLMQITHVLRGEEFIPSTPKFVNIYRAFGWDTPKFVHLPVVVGPDKKKLSKRHGATSVLDYRAMGYLPEALCNFLVLLGWSLDDKTDVMDRETMIQHFSIDRLGKTSAVFNIEKLDWFNGVYIRQLPTIELAERLMPFLERGLPNSVARPISVDRVAVVVPLIQDRLKRLDEAPALLDFLFVEKLDVDPALLNIKGVEPPAVKHALEAASARIEQVQPFTPEALEAILRPLAEELGLRAGQLFGAIRVAITGRTVAPPLFETIAALGKQVTISRLRAAVSRIG